MRLRNWGLGMIAASALLAADPAVEQARKKVADKKYDEAITQLDAANKKKPTPEVTKALAAAYLAKGGAAMVDQSAPPRLKYTTALQAYRQVLKYDKDNAEAKQNILKIENVYKSMGRPVPE